LLFDNSVTYYINLMKRGEIDTTTVNRAIKFQRRADRYTAFRKDHSDKLGIIIGLTKRHWSTFIGACFMAYTDFKDGRDARKAQRLLGVTRPLSNGHTEDPLADKVFRKAMLGGIELRAVSENDITTIRVLRWKQQIDKERDARMARSRELAARYTDISLGAISINRIKTATEMTGILVHVSPPAKNELIRQASLALMAVGSVIGLVGEYKYTNMVNAELARQSIDKQDLAIISTAEVGTTSINYQTNTDQ